MITSAIVLCAGRGKRLRPHTDNTPKPLLPVAGKPTLDFILSSLRQAGVKKVVLVTHYLSEQIESYAQAQSFYSIGDIACVKQAELAGTADAAMAALAAVPEWFTQTFILTASDYLVPNDFYTAIVETHEQSGKAITVSLKRLPDEELSQRSSVRFDRSGAVLEVVEKPLPGKAPSNLGANLVFVLPADIVEVIEQVAPSSRGEKEIQSAVNGYLAANGTGSSLVQATPIEWSPELSS